ncbi:MAG TPA: hypothetical protein VJJ47_03145 [Candidatus Paceibacterota bacterium]
MRLWLAVAIVALLVGGGSYLYLREPAAPADTASAAIDRLLAGRANATVAPWLSSGKVGALEISGRFARATIIGEGGREAIVLLAWSLDGTWRVVSVGEGAPTCSAVARYGFPLSLVDDCTVGAVSTVADALAAGASGGTEIRVFGVVELSDDPSCQGCVFLSSGGISVRLDVSLEDLERAGIQLGDAVVVSGGLNENLALEATSVLAIGSESGASSGGTTSSGNEAQPPPPAPASQPAATTQPIAPEPATAPTPPPDVSPPKPGAPRRYQPTAWYTNPLDLDTSAAQIIQLIDL